MVASSFVATTITGFSASFSLNAASSPADDLEIVHGIAVGSVAGVDQMRDQARALDVLQKADAQSRAGVRAFDQAGQIGDDKRAPAARSDGFPGAPSAETTPRPGSSVVNG